MADLSGWKRYSELTGRNEIFYFSGTRVKRASMESVLPNGLRPVFGCDVAL